MNYGKIETTKFPAEITINNEIFSFARIRDYGQGVLYKNDQSYLRLGEERDIREELSRHREFEKRGFPVAKILNVGVYKNFHFYQEESIGDVPFHVIFQKENAEIKKISPETFAQFLRIVAQYVAVQRESSEPSTEDVIESYFANWFFGVVAEEAPHLQALLADAKKKARGILKKVPATFSHNDFNAYNILPEGVIDFAYSSKMPLGYDWSSALRHQEFFPVSMEFESYQKYTFSQDQQRMLIELFQNAASKNNLDFASLLPTLYLGRLVWSAAHMQKYPKIRDWRFKKLEKELLEYLAG